jgi:hypothetical protein
LAAVGAGVDVGDAVDHKVVLVVAVSVDGPADAAVGDNAGYGAGEVEEGSSVEGEIDDLIAGEDAAFVFGEAGGGGALAGDGAAGGEDPDDGFFGGGGLGEGKPGFPSSNLQGKFLCNHVL